MTTATQVTELIHFFIAAFWTGSAMFFGLYVAPAAGSAVTDRLVGRFTTLSRASALVLGLTGFHLATLYEHTAFVETAAGNAVVAMVVLWAALIGVLEVANARVEDGNVGPSATRLYQVGALLAALLLVDAGLLSTGIV